MLLSRLMAILAMALAIRSASWIESGKVWYDTDGKKIDAHGGSIFQKDDVFYWIGFSVAQHITPVIYSSSDLMNWKNLGPQAPSIVGLWRPKLVTPNNESFWIFGQQDRYSLSLKSTELLGGYQQAAKVHLPPSNYTYSDTGIFYDEPTSTWYLLTSADHNTIQINKINTAGNLGDCVATFKKGAFEAPGILRADGLYFLVVSGKTGWRSNPNKVFWATSLSGPWEGGTDVAPAAENTYSSQNTFELTIKGSHATAYIYMGDAWDSDGSAASNYVWLPMNVNTSAKSITLEYYPKWKVDVKTGIISTPNDQMPS